MSGRTFDSGKYRYGFNGKEKDDEVKGGNNQQDYGMRIYDSRLGKFLSVDPLGKSYPWWSSYAFAGNTPIQAIDLDGLEIYYSQNGNKIGTYGNSTEIRVVNNDQLAKATSEFAAYNTAIEADPQATNEFLGQTLLTDGSVAYSDYFTTVKDVAKTSDKNFKFHSFADADCNHNCNAAASKQLADAGETQTGAEDAIQTKVNNTSQTNAGKPNLNADAIGGSIYTMTQLKKGNAVMVGVEVQFPNGAIGTPPGKYKNYNARTSHFVVINSSTVDAKGNVTFGYIDNASNYKWKGVNPGNQFTLNKQTGSMKDDSDVITGSNQKPASTGMEVTEVRKNN